MSKLLSEILEDVISDVSKVTAERWRWSTNGNIVPETYTDNCEIAAVYSEHMDDIGVPDNATAIISAVNFIRDHGPALAALARRVEGAAKVKVRGKVGEVCMVPVSHDYCGQRVALVPVEGGA